MSVLNLLSRLKELEITVQLENDNLKINAPEERLTPGLIDELKDRKREIIEFLKKNVQKKSRFAPIVASEKKEYYELSSAQRRLYILQQMEPDNISYNMPHIFSLRGGINIEKLKKSFERLIFRHEALRTSIEMFDEKPIQRVTESGEAECKTEILTTKHPHLADSNPHTIREIIDDFVRPFDLSCAPLLHLKLVKTGSDEWLLLIDMHHIINDGISQRVLTQEFARLYAGEELPPLKLHYKDYSEWLLSRQVQETLEKQEEYWLQEFDAEIPVLSIPTDYPRPEIQSFAGNTRSLDLSSEETGGLIELTRTEGVTLFMLLLSLFNVLLSKISNQEDIVVGTPIAGRRHADLQHTIGMFVNTLALRNYPSGKKPFSVFLGGVKERVLKAFENQDYPFEDLVEKVAVERDISRNPLFDTMIVLQNPFESSVEKEQEKERDGLDLQIYNYDRGSSKFDLTLGIIEKGDELGFSFEYCTELFSRETIQRFFQYFKTLISSVIENPDRKILEIEIITESEKRQLLYEFNDTKAGYPGHKTIHRLFAEQVERVPGQVALLGTSIGLPGTRPLDEIQLTYYQLNEKSNLLARLLLVRGAGPGSIVGIMVERSIDMVIGILAILKLGGAYLPAGIDYPEHRIRFMLADSSARVMVSTRTLAKEVEKFRSLEIETVFIEEIGSRQEAVGIREKQCRGESMYSPAKAHSAKSKAQSESYQDIRSAPCAVRSASSPENLAYVIYTSGTTGNPKGVLIEHRNVVRLLWNDRFLFDFSDRDVWTMFHSFCFDFSVWEMYGALLYGAKLIIVPRLATLDFLAYLKILKEKQVTILNQTPSAFYNLMDIELQHPGKELNIRYIIFGGEALHPVYLKNWKDRYPGTKLVNMYGITETTVHVTFKEVGDDEIEANISNIGRPIPTLSTYGMDRHLRLVPIGVLGEMVVGGDGLSRGYLNEPELTNKKFVENFYKPEEKLYISGDLVRLSNKGEFEYLGRIDDQVKIRGFRVELGEIVNRLRNHEEIKDAVVLPRYDAAGFRCLCAYVVMDKGKVPGESADSSGLKEYLSRTLPDYMIPSYFVHIDKIPLTANGKLDRKALPEPEAEVGDGYIPPRNEVEEKLVEIWGELLGIEKNVIGIDSGFFDLGGHSLRATELVSRIHKALNVRVPLAVVFKTPNIRRLTEYIRGAKEDKFTFLEAVEKKEYYPLSSSQKRLYLIQQRNSQSTLYNMPEMFLLREALDKEKLQEIFMKVIKRHESLRTAIQVKDGEPVQRIYKDVEFKIEYNNHDLHPASECADHTPPGFIRPFDLSQAPLLRVGMINTGDRTQVMMIDMHHIISDGISHMILERDFRALYAGEQLAELRIQYKDFSQWQRKFSKTDEKKRQEDFWLREFAGDIPVLRIPTDYPRPAVQSFAGDVVGFEFDGEETEPLKELAKEGGGTLFMVLLAIYNVLLSKLSGQEDIIVGTGIAARKHPELERIIGMFVNTLALRNYPTGKKTFREFLGEVKDRTLKAFDNHDYLFEDLVEKTIEKRDVRRNPLFDTVLIVQNMEGELEKLPEVEKPGTETNSRYNRVRTSKFDLSFYCAEAAGKLFFTVEYCTKLFKKETIETYIGYFKEIAAKIVDNPEILLEKIDISRDILAADTTVPQYEFQF